MDFLMAAHTDVGIRKKTNQDSLLVQKAETDYGPALLAVMCDGMGGLAKGEVASACLIHEFEEWFATDFPQMLVGGLQPEMLQANWEGTVQNMNIRIMRYGADFGIDLGTTCVALLIVGDTYYVMNIGDSRAYMMDNNIYQLTKDQTYIQREMDEGRMTYEESLVSPQRNVLLQCIGASAAVTPDFYIGAVTPNQTFLLCCDGFRHVITPEEMYKYLSPKSVHTADEMQKNLEQLTQLNMQREENDNISAILIRTQV